MPTLLKTRRTISFRTYRRLQDRWIGSPLHIIRTKADFNISGMPTLRELEEHLILFEMSVFEVRYVHYLVEGGITYSEYIKGEVEEMGGETNSFFTGVTIHHPPDKDECAAHYIESNAHDTYRARFWHLVI